MCVETQILGLPRIPWSSSKSLSSSHYENGKKTIRWIGKTTTMHVHQAFWTFLRACLHGGGGPQIGEVTCGGSPHLSCKRHQIKMTDYMDRRVTSPKRVTSPTWGPPTPCKQPFSRRCTTTTWKCLISRFVEDVNTRQQLSFSFPGLW